MTLPITPKIWRDVPALLTPISAASLEDLESRMGAYTDAQISALRLAGGANWRGIYNAGTTYAIGDGSTGSDGNNYISLVGGNIGHDPVSDGGVHWSPILPATVTNVSSDYAAGLIVKRAQLPYFDALNGGYGILADGVQLADGVMSSSSNQHNLASASATFTVADIGKRVVVQGAGAAGVPLFTTISAFVDAHNVTLTAAASSTVASAVFLYGTDDTAALQALITLAATAGGGVIKFSKICRVLIFGAQQTGTAFTYAYSGQLLLPPQALTARRLSIIFEGPAQAPLQRWGAAVEPAPDGSAVLVSNATTGNIIDVQPGDTNGVTGMSNILAVFRDMFIGHCYSLPTGGAIKLYAAASCDIRRCTISPDLPSTSIGTGGAGGVGLYLPYENNAAHVYVGATEVYGYNKGIIHSEHTVLDNSVVRKAGQGVLPQGGHGNLSEYRKMCFHDCITAIAPNDTNGGYIVGTLEMENTTSFIVNDPNSVLIGKIHLCYSGPTNNTGFNNLGAQNLNFADVTQGDVGWMEVPPHDKFARIVPVGSGHTGACDLTCHPWNVISGTWGTSPGPNLCYYPHGLATNVQVVPWYSRRGSNLQIAALTTNRYVTAKINTPAGNFDAGIVLCYSQSSGNYLYVTLNNSGLITLFKNVAGTPTQLAVSGAAAVTNSHSGYIITCKIVASLDPTTAPTVQVFKGTVSAISPYTLVTQDLTDLIDTNIPAKSQGLIYDGLYSSSSDTGTTCSEYQVTPG